ncbi:MAG: Creatininase, partial [Microvirga sp.]|nr:Creatininase [Microvirga sp.]
MAQSDAIVLLPTASVEQHGPHLPTGTDALLCSEVCRRAAQLASSQTPVMVAPTVWMGLAEYHVASGGTFSLSLATYHGLIADLCRSIVRAGFRRLLI